MSSPLPPDPYEALGVAKDADVAAIRSAHRKLVLKCHPDRIQDPALKEKGKETFQKIQQAYELLTDPVRKSRYEQELKLAALRREAAMSRDGPMTRSQSFPMRPAHAPPPTSRQYSHEDGVHYEERKPRNEDFASSRERFEEPLRTSSRKYGDYERASSSTKKSTEKERPEKNAKAAWTRATSAVNFGIRVKKEAEKTRATKEAKDRARQKERSEKEQRSRHAYVDSDSEDSDTATHVTSSTVKPSRPTTRHSPKSSSSRPSTAPRRQTYGGEGSDDSDNGTASKWEAHHDKTKQYIEKAAAGAGSRPQFSRHESGSYWTSHSRSGSDPDRYPASPKDRERRSYDDPRRPPMPTANSSPANLKPRVEERAPKERRSGASASYSMKDRDSDHRKDMPSFHRSQTMPVGRSSSKHDAAPGKSSNLKHTETHDSGYGSSSTPHTPDPRDESPMRRTTGSRNTSTKYQIVDPDSGDDGASTVRHVDDSRSRRRRYASPEPMNDRRRPDRPRVEIPAYTRSKSNRDSPIDPPKPRRSDSARHYDDRSGRDSNHSSRFNSREKLFAEVDDYEYETISPRQKDKGSTRNMYAESNVGYSDSKYRDFGPGSRFAQDARGGSRRPSMQGVH